jgi:hypothetical protein
LIDTDEVTGRGERVLRHVTRHITWMVLERRIYL